MLSGHAPLVCALLVVAPPKPLAPAGPGVACAEAMVSPESRSGQGPSPSPRPSPAPRGVRGSEGEAGNAGEAGAPKPAAEASGTLASSAGSGLWVAGGIVDVAYLVNSNRPENHLYRGAFTTPRTGEFTINVAGAYVEKQAPATGGWTMQLGLHAGGAVDAVYEGEPRPGGGNARLAGSDVFKHLALANAGGRFGSGTELGLGLFTSPVGIGGLWSQHNWLYSSSWQSNWTPYYLSGLRLSQALPADLRLEAWLVSGWQTISDVNASPSGLLGLYWEPGAGAAEGAWAAAHLYAGPETESLAPETWLVAGSVQAGLDRPGYGLSWVFDGGRGGLGAQGRPDDVGLYTGGALFGRARLWRARSEHPARLDLTARPELWWDPDGLTYGRPGTLVAGAIGLAAHAFDALIVRLEYRYDWSSAEDGAFFRGAATGEDDGLAADQHTIFLNVTAHYALRFGAKREAGR